MGRHPGSVGVTVLVAAGLALGATPSAAEDVQVSFDRGRVTVLVTDAPIRTVLEAWARIGGTRFIDLEAITGPPISVQLRDVPEAEALRILLRPTTGYLAAPRADAEATTSAFDRVLIMSARPRATNRPAPAPAAYAPPPSASTPVPVDGAPPAGGAAITEITENDELDLIERLRQRYQTPPPSAAPSTFGQPAPAPSTGVVPGSDVEMPTSSRPGVILAPPEEPSQPPRRGRPVRPQVGDPSR